MISQYDEFCEELGRLAREAVVDDGAKPGAQIGPLQNKAHFERVKGFLKDAKQDGVIVAGGNVLQRKGYFVEPTIVRDIGDDTRLVREEQFGPILPVLRYAKVEDAIARANDTEFGLGGSVWSKNSSGPSPWPRKSIRARSGSTGISTCSPTFPSGATSSPASEPNWATLAWRNILSPGS